VSLIIRESGPPTGGPVVQAAYKKSSLIAEGEFLYLTVCDDEHYHYHYEYNNNTITIITVWSNNNLNGK
jgi:hypothetical protein